MKEEEKRKRNSSREHARTVNASGTRRQEQRVLSEEEIERRRKARMARRKREALRRRRIILAELATCCVIAVILAVVGVSAVVKSHNKKVKMAKQEEQKIDTIQKEDSDALEKAERMARQYDYDGAIELLKSEPDAASNEEIQSAISEYEKTKETLVEVNPDEVTHVFYHSLVVDPKRGFAGTQGAQFNMWMTTVSEFNKITQSMYDRGYVLIRLRDMVNETTDENGNVKFEKAKIMLPPDKKAFVLSLDDLSYYHSYDGYGIASKMILDEEGKPTCEYVDENGETLTGSYDCVPLLDDFIEEHPDFSYKGARGIIALTGYNGILGYRTDQSYEDRPDDLDDDKVEWLNEHPDFNLETERQEAKKVADAMREEGWEFASHTWGHQYIADISLEKLQIDTQKWMDNVAPLVGGTDTIIFAHGQDLVNGGEYTADNEKYNYLKSQGFNFFCNVDSTQYWTQITENYVRQGRRNLDGYRMYHNPELVSDLFDAAEVFDKERPTPVASE